MDGLDAVHLLQADEPYFFDVANSIVAAAEVAYCPSNLPPAADDLAADAIRLGVGAGVLRGVGAGARFRQPAGGKPRRRREAAGGQRDGAESEPDVEAGAVRVEQKIA